MKIKDAIKMLKSYDSDEEIFIMTWDIECYIELHKITKEEWEKVVNELDEYSFDSISETVSDIIQTELKIIRGEK